jgi:hypothetical protein
MPDGKRLSPEVSQANAGKYGIQAASGEGWCNSALPFTREPQ